MGQPSPPEDEQKKILGEFRKGIESVEQFLAYNGGDYLCGSQLTLGDLNTWISVFNVVEFDLFPLDEFPTVEAWYKRVTSEPGPTRIRKEVLAGYKAMLGK